MTATDYTAVYRSRHHVTHWSTFTQVCHVMYADNDRVLSVDYSVIASVTLLY